MNDDFLNKKTNESMSNRNNVNLWHRELTTEFPTDMFEARYDVKTCDGKVVAFGLRKGQADSLIAQHNKNMDEDQPAKNKIKFHAINLEKLKNLSSRDVLLIDSSRPDALMMTASIMTVRPHQFWPTACVAVIAGIEVMPIDDVPKLFTHYAPVPDIEL